jgi:hypothetical protein
VLFLDPRQALVEFQAAADDAQAGASTLTGRAVLVGDAWVVTRDTFCRDTFVSGLGECDRARPPATLDNGQTGQIG